MTTATKPKWFEQYKVDLEDGEVDGMKIDHFEIEEHSIHNVHYMLEGRAVAAGRYTRLSEKGTLWMTDTPAEISDLYEVFRRFNRDTVKRVLVNGLGIGMVVKAALLHDHIESVDVVELDPRVVKLVSSQMKDPRIHIHTGDAYTIKWPVGTRWDVAWHDVWPTICGDNAEGMARLNRRYGRRVSWQGCWVEEEVKRINRRDRADSWRW